MVLLHKFKCLWLQVFHLHQQQLQHLHQQPHVLILRIGKTVMVMDVNGMNRMTLRDVQTMETILMVEWVQQMKRAVGVEEAIAVFMIRKRVDVTIEKDALLYKVVKNVRLHCLRQNALNLMVQNPDVGGWDVFIGKISKLALEDGAKKLE